MSDSILLTIPETAAALGVSRATVYNTLLHREDFPVVRFGGAVRVNREALQLWCDRQTRGLEVGQ